MFITKKPVWDKPRFHRYFEGEPTPTPTPEPTPTPAPTPPPGFKAITTQEQLDSFMAEHRRKLVEKNNQLIQELEAKKQAANTSEADKQDLQSRIEQLQGEYQTEKQQKDTEIQRLNTKLETETKKLKAERETWENRYTQLLIENDLLSAASNPEFKAYNPQQIVELLRNKTRKVEALEDGKPTGKFVSKVKFTGKKDGKPVELDLTPYETVKLMAETPEEYGNLFKSGANGGIGDFNSNGGTTRLPDISQMSMDDYKKNRPAILEKASPK